MKNYLYFYRSKAIEPFSMRKRINRLALVTLMIITSCVNAMAQQLQATRAHYNTEDGLCSNAVAYLTQDDFGYVWIATWNGLSRFDGYNFYNYKTGAASHIPNLHNRIYNITIDMQQNVWLRMYDGRVFVMRRAIDTIINPFEGISGSSEFRTSCDIAVASNGEILISIDGIGIYSMLPTPTGFTTPQLITTSGLTITSMAEGYQGDFWLGTDQGVHRLDASNKTVERKGYFLDEHVNCLFSNGYNIFVGTKSGKLYSFAYGAEPKQIYDGNLAINQLFVDSHGMIWISDTRQGCVRIDPQTGETKFYTQRVTTPDYDGNGGFFHESTGILWARMNHGGFGYYNREADEFEYFHNDPTNPWNLLNTVNADLELEEGVVFESTGRRGLEKLEIMKNTIERKMIVDESQESNLANETRALYYDKERHLLLIGNKASKLFFYDDKGNIVNTITQDDNGNPIGRSYGISKDSKGNYWLSSKDYGLFCIKPTGSGYSVVNMCHNDDDPNSLSHNGAYSSIEDKNGNIWVATYGGGINVLTRNKKGEQVFLHPKNGMVGYPYHSHMKARTVALDAEGNVWAGTTDGILIMSCKGGEVNIKRLEASEELPDSILNSNDVVCLGLDQKGSMWVGTHGGGIAHTTGRDSQGRWLFANYGAQQGLPGEEIKSLTFDSKGNVWFATDHIICSFNTAERVFSTYSSLDGVDDTMCSEGAAVTLSNDDILIGTVNGYYYVDRKKLENNNASIIKLHITDFWVNDELQSPRFNDLFPMYVPEARQIEMHSHSAHIALRFASLNYQLQHRVHYQYRLKGYDVSWHNADKSRTANYQGLPSGTYTFQVRAFLLESPDLADLKELTIVVPPHFFMTKVVTWIYMLIAAIFLIWLMFWRQNRIRKAYAPVDPSAEGQENDSFSYFRRRKQHKKTEEPEEEETDEYEIME